MTWTHTDGDDTTIEVEHDVFEEGSPWVVTVNISEPGDRAVGRGWFSSNQSRHARWRRL